MRFAERAQEMAALRAAWDAARAGASTTLVVAGPAGIGKSRLIDEFVAHAEGPVRTLAAGCVDIGLPFAPFTAAIRDVLGELGPSALVERLPGRSVGELSRLLPALGPPPAGTDELSRARLFEQVLDLLRALAAERPLLLVIEDVHRADSSTRDLLRFIVGNQRSAPGLLLVVMCRTDVDRAHPGRGLLAELTGAWVRRVDLSPLSRNGVAAMLRDLLDREPDADLTEDVHRRSEGNPFFVEALAHRKVPASVRDVLLAPVADLPAPTRDAVRAAAAGGAVVGHALLAAVTGLDEATLRPATDANVLVVHGGGYRFRQELVREAVYEALLPGERVRLHVRYGEAIERHPSLAAPGRASTQLAQHWSAVADHRPEKALTTAWQAAADAGRALAHAEQLQMLRTVLRLWKRAPDELGVDHRDVLTAAMDAAAAAGEIAEALRLLDEVAVEVGESGALLLRRGELRHALGRAGGLDDLRAASTLLPATDPLAATALALLAHRLLTVPREREGRAVALAAIQAARRSGNVHAELLAAADLAYALARAGDVDSNVAELARARAEAKQVGDVPAQLHVLRLESDLLHGAGRYAQAEEAARTALAVCAAAGLARTSGPAHAANLAESLIACGEWDTALAVIDDALGCPPLPGIDAFLLVLRGTVQLARGDLREAGMAAAYARAVYGRGYPDTQDLLPLSCLEIDLRRADDRPPEAAELVERALRMPDIEESPRYLWPLLASAAHLPHLRSRLRLVAADLAVIGPVQQAHRLTFHAAADPTSTSWDRAAAAWAALGEPYAQAKALVAAAALDPTADRLRTAAALAERLGAAPLRREIGALATAARVPPAADAGDPHGLTARELEVLRHLAAGRTNRQIGTELYISAKTVSTHVTHILAKLGVPGRVQAATAAHRLKILPPT